MTALQLSLRITAALLLAGGLVACEGDDGDDGAPGTDATADTLRLQELGRFTDSAAFDEGAAEIVAFDAGTARAFVVNSDATTVDVLDLADPASPSLVGTIDATALGAGANSVDAAGGIVAVAIEADPSTDPGLVAFYNAGDLSLLGTVTTGALPDMVTFTPDGSRVLVANEGEPSDDYAVDPEGSVTIIDLNAGVPAATATTVGFADFNDGGSRAADLPAMVRVFGNFGRTAAAVTAFSDADPATLTLDDASAFQPGDFFTLASDGDPLPYQVASVAGNVLTLTTGFDGDTTLNANLGPAFLHDGASSVAQDLEPEYIAVSPDGATAFVALQENNALAVIDIENARVTRIAALGVKDHNLPGFGLDASDRDGGVNIRNWPVMGMYMPDSVAAFNVDGESFVITANEGDSREYDAFVEEIRFADAPREGALADAAFDEDSMLGRLATTLTNDTDGNGQLDRPWSYGARSFSIWTAAGRLVFDSGDDFEVITAARFGADFNNDNDENDGDSRSDAKGPEPEAVAVGTVNGRTYAFIGLERVGGIMVFEVTNPESPDFVQYLNNRDFGFDIDGQIANGTASPAAAGDLGPEGFRFVPATDSPTGDPLLLVGNEVSGTTTIYRISVIEAR